MRNRPIRSDFSLPLAVMSALVVGFCLFIVILLVGEFDRAAQAREQMIVEQGVSARSNEIAAAIEPQIFWDDAVAHLDNRFDRQWARDNLGTYLNSTVGITRLTVIDRTDRPIYASVDGVDARASGIDLHDRQIRSLIATVRAGEARRGLELPGGAAKGIFPSPVQANGIVSMDREIFLVVAMVVSPDFGKARPLTRRAPIVIAAMPMAGSFMNLIADRFLLHGVHLHADAAGPETGEAKVSLRDIGGAEVARLDWLPQTPGMEMLRRLGVPIVSITLILMGALIILYRRSHDMARGLIASEARATHLAFHDTLTGIPNRAMFIQRLKEGLRRLRRSQETLTVLCMDLDRFKDINDTFGHLVGDELIREVAARLSSQCRAHELIARLSGDEFAILQMGATASGAASLASRLCDAMSEPFELSTGRVFISCSIGIAMTDNGDLEPPELMRQADLALYRAKDTARGHFCFFEREMDALIKARRLLEDDLREALLGGDLCMAYQPQVDIDGEMTGAEALLRWHHPTRGDISPAHFVPVAEQCGLIQELGMFTLRRAFEDSYRWKGLRIAINVSANQLQTKDFLDCVAGLVDETGVDPARFELEITEGVLLRDDPQLHETLDGLRVLGFSLALDDFGTGYSSLSYLRSYPISKIKIDRSFVSNIGLEDASNEVIGAMITLARALKLDVIAEGVETLEQRAWLSAAGCTDVQGYLFGKAMMPEQLDELWSAGRGELHPLEYALVAC